MKEKLIELLFKYKNAFATDKEPLGSIIGHELDIMLNVKNPYPPLLRRPAYPASPKAREALQVHIKELMDLGVLRKPGHNEQVEVTTPFIITFHNGKSRMVGDIRALNTYTILDRYPIRRIHEKSTQLSQARIIKAMDSLKVFHQNFLTDSAKKTTEYNSALWSFQISRNTIWYKKCTFPLSKNDEYHISQRVFRRMVNHLYC
ncbi:hypothetical protein O181_067653 [Austropuccinia psidii MF-1]|uniref:Uncharacterized protein n=1 Tax=Austropuccinia psidii MF-1 TaxID=1389203 RepID=A0A9Q3EZ60_9BASI|nr:hypothetical protein [Austropuccinia psidii MF-1]